MLEVMSRFSAVRTLSNALTMARKFEWHPLDFVSNQEKAFALVILNGELRMERRMLADLWTRAKVRHTVDGGTDLWMSTITELQKQDNADFPAIPDIVSGDMDSISPESYKKCKGVAHIEPTPDQDKTDFTKAIEFLVTYIDARSIKVDTIVVICEVIGRLDHTLSNLNTLFTSEYRQTTKGIPIIMLASDSVTWLLTTGEHVIHIPTSPLTKCLLRKPGSDWLALLPVGKSCLVTSAGLKWNLNGDILQFGGLVSSSNTYGEEPVITIQTDNPLIWSMGLDARQK